MTKLESLEAVYIYIYIDNLINKIENIEDKAMCFSEF